MLAAGAMSSLPSSCPEKIVAIKPKTVRLRPMTNYHAIEVVASKGSSDASCQEGSRNVQAPVQDLEQTKLNFINLPAPSSQQNSFSHADVSQIYEPSNLISRDTELDTKAQQPSSSGDGYNWRKYGQKQVKGSDYPRSYYKCTYPNCPVKKKIERSFDGRIAEVVYEGEHNHPKPHPSKRISLASQGQCAVSDEHERNDHLPLGFSSEGNVSAGRMDNSNNYNAVDLSGFPTDPSQNYLIHDYDNLLTVNFENTATQIGNSSDRACKVGSIIANMESHKLDRKRRKIDGQVGGSNAAKSGEAGCSSSMQNFADHDSSGDGFNWKKYGQKVVKGNTHPRSYYKCTSPRCNVRKYVERAPDNSGSFVTTYEGKHNHEMPTPK